MAELILTFSEPARGTTSCLKGKLLPSRKTTLIVPFLRKKAFLGSGLRGIVAPGEYTWILDPKAIAAKSTADDDEKSG
jgi:hypothetical protein